MRHLPNQMPQRAQGVAQHGGVVVGEVVDTMRGIQDPSSGLAEIFNVIDRIALPTNILALNAALVEDLAAAAMSLRDQAQGLSQLVGSFRL